MQTGIKKAGGISFGVSMATGTLQKNVSHARKVLGGFVSDTAKSLSRLSSMFGGVGGALSVGSLAWGVNQSINRIDALNQSAKTLGVTTDMLSRLGYVAGQAESSQESLQKGLARVARSTDDARRGIKETADLYSALGVNAKDLAKLAPHRQFLKIGEAIGKLDNKSAQLVATQRIFGRSSADLVNVFRLTRDELSKLTAEADKFGITVAQKNADSISKAKDAIDKLSAAWDGLLNQIAIAGAGPAEKVVSATSSEIGGINAWWRYIKGQSDRLNKLFGDGPSLYPRMERFQRPGVAPLSGNAGRMFSSAGISQVDMFRRLLGTPQQIWAGLSSPIAIAQRKLAMSEVGRASSTWKDKPTSDLLGDAVRGVMQTGIAKNLMQIGQGMRDSPLAQLQRQLFGANLQASMAGTQSVGRSVASFSAVESGSLAAYQQRIRGQQQFDRIEVKQLDVLKSIDKKLDRPPVEMVAEGSV